MLSLKGRKIIENILLLQEVVKDYGCKNGRPRCALKVDIRKTFDSISWPFVLTVIEAMGFPSGFLLWIKECITTPSFSVKINA